jgi:sigma-54 dependent transcriptional regulator, acetoin dehydrogenase operon transcriptional activator AcoR
MASHRIQVEGGRAVETALTHAQRARLQLIRQSHERCTAFGLTRIERPDYAPMLRSDLGVARERNQRLYQHAAPVMEMLFEQIVNTESMILLTDAHGTILHSVGDDVFIERAGKVALTPGVNWAEHSKGTNAIGTALFEERPTLVHAEEHFMHANQFLTCSAVPIFDPRGSMLGILDVTGDQRSYHQHTMGLVRMSARMIENHWLSDDYSNRLRLHFHSRPEFIGTLLEGIIIVEADGRILGGNQSALDQLSLTPTSLRAHSLITLFGTTVAAVHDHFRAPLPVPLWVSPPGGPPFHLVAHFDWGMRAIASGAVASERTPAVPSGTVPPVVTNALTGGADAGLDFLLTGDAQMQALVHKARRIVDRDIALLIVGEVGTGKELLARAVHHESSRAKQRFVSVDCGALAADAIEAELFGSDAGAGPRRKGVAGSLLRANGGTLFLDQIEDMPLPVQAKLLRVLQQRCVQAAGSQKPIAIDVAVITATRANLRELIERQQFMEDLYYRLNGLVLRLPALRERSDLDVLAQRILRAESPHATPTVAPALMALLRRYSWPGNVRQLAGVLRTAAVMAAGETQITQAHLSDDVLEDIRRLEQGMTSEQAMAAAQTASQAAPQTASHAAAHLAAQAAAPWAAPGPVHRPAGVAPVSEGAPDAAAPTTPDARTLQEVEVDLIRRALDAAQGNISEASKRLGISRNTIYRKLRWNRPG